MCGAVISDDSGRIQPRCPIAVVQTGVHVIRTLQTLHPVWGRAADCLRSDNDSEFVPRQVEKWLLDHGIGTHYIDLGSPWQNPFIESFNSIFRMTFLNRWCFLTLAQTKALTHRGWRRTMRSVQTDRLEVYYHSNSYGNSVARNRLSTKWSCRKSWLWKWTKESRLINSLRSKLFSKVYSYIKKTMSVLKIRFGKQPSVYFAIGSRSLE